MVIDTARAWYTVNTRSTSSFTPGLTGQCNYIYNLTIYNSIYNYDYVFIDGLVRSGVTGRSLTQACKPSTTEQHLWFNLLKGYSLRAV